MGAATAHDGVLAQARWETFGTSVVLRVQEPGALASARAAAERELETIDRVCSRFRPDSELSQLNARAGHQVRVSSMLMEALALALRAAELTDGDVDPTIGRALELAGYDRDWAQVQRRQAHEPPQMREAQHQSSADTHPRMLSPAITVRARSGWRTIELDSRRAIVRVPRGIRLDLGATAKAWAADRAAAAAAAAAECGVLVSIGGDIATCGSAPAGGWLVHVTDDHRSDASAPGQTIAISCGGLATSSTTVRHWRLDGRTMHHIIDPRTGTPARSPWRTVSVAAATCADANIATTAALVRGASASDWLAELGLPARLVDHDGRARHVGQWPARAGARRQGGSA